MGDDSSKAGMMRTERIALVLLALVFVLMGCAGAGPSSSSGEVPKPGMRRIVAAVASAPVTPSRQYHPGFPPGVDALEELVHVGLAQVDNGGSLRPQLAEEVPTLENGLWRLSSDGRMEITWKLKRSAVWHDGEPVTADDVLFAAMVSQDPEMPISKLPVWDSVEAIEAPDPHTVLIKWKKVFFEADRLFTTYSQTRALPLPKHLLEQPYRDHKESFLRLPYWTTEFVGTGPYRVLQWTEGSQALLFANDRYVFGRPRIDEIEVRFIPDVNALVVNILAGEVDIVLGRGLSLDQAEELRGRWRDGRVDLAVATWVIAYPQHIDPTPPTLPHPQFKRALLHALDRQAMVDGLMHGMVPIAHSLIDPTRPEYQYVDGSIVRYEYDLRKAEQLLTELGYQKGADGVFRDSANQRLSVEVGATAGLDVHEKAVLSIADHWQRAGLAVTPALIPPQEERDRQYKATHPGFYVVRGGTDLTVLDDFRSSAVPLPETRFIGGNLARYQSTELDGLIERFHATIAKPERMGILAQIIHRMTSEVLPMGLFYDVEAAPVSDRLANAGVKRGTGSTSSWNAHEWDSK